MLGPGVLERRGAAGEERRRGVPLALRDQRAGERDLHFGHAPVRCGEAARARLERRAQQRFRVGVTTAIYSPSGGSVGIGFAIPAETVKSVVMQLKETGTVTRGWIGVQIQPVTDDIANSLGLSKAEGALVDEPEPDSPASTAGIKPVDAKQLDSVPVPPIVPVAVEGPVRKAPTKAPPLAIAPSTVKGGPPTNFGSPWPERSPQIPPSTRRPIPVETVVPEVPPGSSPNGSSKCRWPRSSPNIPN